MSDIPNRPHTADDRFTDEPRHGDEVDVSDQTLSVLSTTGLSRLLYQMGRTFDGLSSTRLSTQEFLETGNPQVLGSKAIWLSSRICVTPRSSRSTRIGRA